jgi:hypothetical protein
MRLLSMVDTSDIKRRVTALETGHGWLTRVVLRLVDWVCPRRRNRWSRALTPEEARAFQRQVDLHMADEDSEVRKRRSK